MALHGCPREGRMTILIPCIDIGAAFQELSDASVTACGAGNPQTGDYQIMYIDVEPMSNYLCLVGLVQFQKGQGIVNRFGLGLGIRSMFEEQLKKSDLLPQHGDMKWRYRFRAFVNGYPCLDQQFAHFHAPMESSHVKDKPAFLILDQWIRPVFE
ncbi:hypothetical protein CEP54_007575 [Fusarium duplospermum]|uniref:Uncharacterized protein n=1 Tax=Fusarium duplospermum TaxID=1325734 RepID=A0A428Q0K1_9HYPO|nr:hypothetical protein CEP54_007575 [Fusarium duplospermum]